MMAAQRGARLAAPQVECSGLFDILLGEGCEDNTGSSTVPRQLASLPSAKDDKDDHARAQATDISNSIYYGSNDYILQRLPDTPAITSGHRTVVLDGPSGWASVSTQRESRITRSITTGSTARDSSVRAAFSSPSARSPSLFSDPSLEPNYQFHPVQQFQGLHQSDSSWSARRHYDAPGTHLHLAAPITPTDDVAAAARVARGPPGRPGAHLASSSSSRQVATAAPTATTTTATTHLRCGESTAASASSTAAAATTVADAACGAETAQETYPAGGPRGLAAGPHSVSSGPGVRPAYSPGPYFAGHLHSTALHSGPAVTAATVTGTISSFAAAAGAAKQPLGAPGMWLRGWPQRPAPDYGATWQSLGYYDAMSPPPSYMDQEEVGAPLDSSNLPSAPSVALSCGTYETSGGRGGSGESAPTAIGMPAAPPPPSAGAVSASGAASPGRHGQIHFQPRPHPHAHSHADASTRIEAGGSAPSLAADHRMSYIPPQHPSAPWPSPTKPGYRNGISTAAAADLAGALPVAALSPSSCSSGQGQPLEACGRPSGPYMLYPPLPPPHPHAHAHHLHPHPYPHHRMLLPKRYAWVDGYGRYDPGYTPYWPTPTPYYSSTLCRSASWHHIAMPPTHPSASSHGGARMAAEPGGGNGVARNSAAGVRAAASPEKRRHPHPHPQQQQQQRQQQHQQHQHQQPPGTQPEDTAADVYDARGGHRPMGPVYGRSGPVPFPSPLVPYPSVPGMRGGTAAPSGSSPAAAAAARVIRSPSLDSLGTCPGQPRNMPPHMAPMAAGPREPQQQQQQVSQRDQQQGNPAALKEEPPAVELPTLEHAVSTPPPAMLESRESFKRRRLAGTWSLPGPLAPAPSASVGLLQAPPQQPQPQAQQSPPLQQQLSVPCEPHLLPARTQGSAPPPSPALPPSPFSFASPPLHMQPVSPPSSALGPAPPSSALGPAPPSSLGPGPVAWPGAQSQGLAMHAPPPPTSPATAPTGNATPLHTVHTPFRTATAQVAQICGGFGAQEGVTGDVGVQPSTASGTCHGGNSFGEPPGATAAAGGVFGADSMEEDPVHAADLEDSFEAFAMKLGFDDLDICMAEEPPPPPPQQPPPPPPKQQQQQEQQQQYQNSAVNVTSAGISSATSLPDLLPAPPQQQHQAQHLSETPPSPALHEEGYHSGAPMAGVAAGTVAAVAAASAAAVAAATGAAAASRGSPSRSGPQQAPGGAPWSLEALPQPRDQEQPLQGQEQQLLPPRPAAPNGEPGAVRSSLPSLLLSSPTGPQTAEAQPQQPQQQTISLDIKAGPGIAIKTESPAVLLTPSLFLSVPPLLPNSVLLPAPLSPRDETSSPPQPTAARPRGNGPRRLNGNSSRTVRSQHTLLQLSSPDQLPGPVRVTVAAGSSTRSSGDAGSRRGGGGSSGGGGRGGHRVSDGGASDDDDDDDSNGSGRGILGPKASSRGGGGGSGGGGTSGGGTSGSGVVQGIFHVKPYLEGRKCIDHGGEMVSRSAFERAGGSMMAKWYRSIKVLPDGISLGKWLVSNGLPVLKGNPRRSKKSNALAVADGA